MSAKKPTKKKTARPRRSSKALDATVPAAEHLPAEDVAPRSAPSTLREVAKLAGVSVMTVSNVINGHFGMMAAKTRGDVEAAVRKLNYRPHSSARALRSAKRLSVGLMIVDPSTTFIADAFTTHVMAGLGNHLSKRGYALVIQGVAPDRLEASTLLRWHQSDCLCVVPSGDRAARHQLYRRLSDLHQPILTIQDEIPDFLKDGAAVRQDDRGGAWQLTARLLAAGARRLAYLREAHAWPAADNREHGIRDAMTTEPGARLDVIAAASSGFADTTAALARYVEISGAPDAVIGANDQMGIAAMRFLTENGYAIPDRVRVTGFNAFDFYHYAAPRLTTVRSAAYDIGEAAAVALLHRLTSGSFARRDTLLPVSLVEGQSA
jgi:DNA-binding LacI/PurR family transcriptional regulator